MTPSDSPTRTYDPERTVTANDSPEHAATTPRFDAPFDDALTVPGYELLAELGRGGMGVVYKARHVGLNRLVALKMILSGAHAGDRDRVRFLAEAEAVAAIRHPNVLQVYDFGNHAGRPYMALEYCEGGALTAWLKDRGPLPPREAAELLEQIARGVGAAHELGIVHRDLKPGNIPHC